MAVLPQGKAFVLSAGFYFYLSESCASAPEPYLLKNFAFPVFLLVKCHLFRLQALLDEKLPCSVREMVSVGAALCLRANQMY